MKIKFINGDRKNEILDIPLSEVTIGREDCNILRLSTEGVSRFHATLKQTPDRGWIIIDHDSTNGVKVNGRNITGMQTVFDGDTVTIGEQEFTLEKLNPSSPAVEFKPILTTGPAVSTEKVAAAPGTSVKSVEEEVETDKKDGDKLAEDFLKQLASSGDALFKKNDPGTSAVNNEQSAGTKKRRSMRFNIIFYGALAFLLLAAVSTVNKLKNKKSGKTSSAAASIASAAADDAADARAEELRKFYLYFEKKDYSSENKEMRRLEIIIENGILNIKLDDLPAQRKYESSVDIVKDRVNEFETFIRKLNSAKVFHAAERRSSGAVNRRMLIVNGNRLFSQTFADNNTSADYQCAEEELNYMMRSIGFISSVMSREDAEREALEFFNNGQSDYENYRGNPGNLRKAVKYYDAAIRIYEQFSPPHKNLEIARTQLNKARELQKKQVRMYQEEFDRALKLDDVGRMKAALHKIRELTNPESKAYRNASRNLQLLNRRTRSGRR